MQQAAGVTMYTFQVCGFLRMMGTYCCLEAKKNNNNLFFLNQFPFVASLLSIPVAAYSDFSLSPFSSFPPLLLLLGAQIKEIPPSLVYRQDDLT